MRTNSGIRTYGLSLQAIKTYASDHAVTRIGGDSCASHGSNKAPFVYIYARSHFHLHRMIGDKVVVPVNDS
jgi:hypothetical protein